MKVLVPPTECECSFSSGTFSKNNDVTMRKLFNLVTYSTGWKRAKKKGKHLMETTKWFISVSKKNWTKVRKLLGFQNIFSDLSKVKTKKFYDQKLLFSYLSWFDKIELWNPKSPKYVKNRQNLMLNSSGSQPFVL